MEVGNETLTRIQREIQEAQEREEELRKKYNLINNNVEEKELQSPEPPKTPPTPITNGSDPFKTRYFAPNSSKGVMQKFLKMRGKMNMVTLKPKQETQNVWVDSFQPAKITINSDKPIRNGFIPAGEKIQRELKEFEKREKELRLERQKSQPDLMAALAQEEALSVEDFPQNGNGLKPARSLADLCDVSDEELETRNAHSLIRRFEMMKSQ